MTLLTTYLIHSTAVLGLVWILDRFLIRDASLRDTIWKVGLVVSVLSPLVVGVPWPGAGTTSEAHRVRRVAYGHPGSPPVLGEALEERVQRTATVDVACLRSSMGGVAEAPSAVLKAVDKCAVPGGRGLPLWLLVIALVSASLLVRQLWQTYRLWCMLDKAAPLDKRVELPLDGVRVLTVPGLPGPFAAGRTSVALPGRGIEELSERQLAAVLAHEVAHLERRDPFWQWAARLIESICFFQPLNRVCRCRLEEQAELLCDARARRMVGGGRELAESIALVSSWNLQPRMAPGLARARGLASVRVARLLEPRPGVDLPQFHLRVALCALVVALSFALPRPPAVSGVAEVQIVVDRAEGPAAGFQLESP